MTTEYGAEAEAESVNKRPGLRLRDNVRWTLIGNAIYAVAQWGLLVVMAKLGSTEMVGRFALGLAISGPILVFVMMQLRAILATDAKGEFDFSHYLGMRTVTSVVTVLVVCVIVWILGYQFATALTVVLVCVAKTLEAIGDVVFGLFTRYERMDLVAKSQMAKTPLILVAAVAGVQFGGDAFWVAAGFAVGILIVLLLYDLPRARDLLQSQGVQPRDACHGPALYRVSLDTHTLLRLAKLAFPLAAVGAIVSLTGNIPKYTIEHLLGEGPLGIYAPIAYFQIAGRIITAAIGSSVSPVLANHYAAGRARAFVILSAYLTGAALLIGGCVVAFAAVLGEPFLNIAYGAEYAEHGHLFLWLMVANAFDYISGSLGVAMTAARRLNIQVAASGTAMCTVLVACILLVPQHGLMGAAWALAVALAVPIPLKLWVVIGAVRALQREGRTQVH